MTTFTPLSRKKVNWAGEEATAALSDAYEFKIADNFFLNIGDGYKLVISPSNPPTSWASTAKKKVHFPATEAITSTQYLDIGDGYALNIGNGYTLEAGQSGRSNTSWTPKTRKRINF